LPHQRVNDGKSVNKTTNKYDDDNVIFPNQSLDVEFHIKNAYPALTTFHINLSHRFELLSEVQCFPPDFYQILKTERKTITLEEIISKKPQPKQNENSSCLEYYKLSKYEPYSFTINPATSDSTVIVTPLCSSVNWWAPKQSMMSRVSRYSSPIVRQIMIQRSSNDINCSHFTYDNVETAQTQPILDSMRLTNTLNYCDYEDLYLPRRSPFATTTKSSDVNVDNNQSLQRLRMSSRPLCSSSNMTITLLQKVDRGAICNFKIKFINQYDGDPSYGPKFDLLNLYTDHTPITFLQNDDETSSFSTPKLTAIKRSQARLNRTLDFATHTVQPYQLHVASPTLDVSKFHLSPQFKIPPLTFTRCRTGDILDNDYTSVDWYFCHSFRFGPYGYCPGLNLDDRALRRESDGRGDCSRVMAYPLNLTTTLCIAYNYSQYVPCSALFPPNASHFQQNAQTNDNQNDHSNPGLITLPPYPMPLLSMTMTDLNHIINSPPTIYNSLLSKFPHLVRYCSSCLYQLQCLCLGQPCDCDRPCLSVLQPTTFSNSFPTSPFTPPQQTPPSNTNPTLTSSSSTTRSPSTLFECSSFELDFQSRYYPSLIEYHNTTTSTHNTDPTSSSYQQVDFSSSNSTLDPTTNRPYPYLIFLPLKFTPNPFKDIISSAS
jgi:hypothetical protein